MNPMANLLMVYLIPVFTSLSWLLGGVLVLQLSPYSLSISRTAIVGVLLLIYFLVFSRKPLQTIAKTSTCWWIDQAILAISGRTIYYYYSSKALLSISPFEAILVASFLPIIILFFNKIFKISNVNTLSLALGLLACALNIYTLTIYSTDRFSGFGTGHIEMLIAISGFAFHTIYYKAKVKESSPLLPLAVQFLIGAIIMLPFTKTNFLAEFGHLQLVSWGQFTFYSLVCGLLPFVFLHYALQMHSPFLITTISMLAPAFAIVFKSIYQEQPLNMWFIICTIATCSLAVLTLTANKTSTLKLGEKKCIE
ncbi:MAG: hypothetical protein A2Z20_06495 [Bdellovibrionales bacterium RBG_16_40_8]|nr:MAG: hypothetical protein A2Z20_06495 [Bdellovibrionales bacterium RBG_16_40_8]